MNLEQGMIKNILQELSGFIADGMKKFIPEERFIEDFPEDEVDGASIVKVSDAFKDDFFGKIERNVPRARLRFSRLLVEASDSPENETPGIISGLCGQHEIWLAHFIQALAVQEHSKDLAKILGYANNKKGQLRAVSAVWDLDKKGWSLDSSPVTNSSKYATGTQVVSF